MKDWWPGFYGRAVLLHAKDSDHLLVPMLCPDEARCEEMAESFRTIL